jgi:glycosyltransferase involved in cell wall biosynthesis
MKFILYSPVAFEPWDWRNSIEKGIGGSETSHVEMAWRLAARGHDVITYSPIPDDCPGEWRGTKWYPIDQVDWSQDGTWILYRCPEALDNFTDPHPGKTLWLMNQDWDYHTLVGDRLEKLDKMMILCEWHKRYTLERHPELDGKIMVTSNGLKPELIEEAEREGIERNPYRIMFASSPDRGLVNVIKSFIVAREFEPRLELHAFYGFNNLRKLTHNAGLQAKADECERLMRSTTNVFFHGRVTQDRLYREWLKSGLWVYRTNFQETSCITCMEAQALGAIPIVSPVAALDENVHFGQAIPGDADDNLVGAEFAQAIVQWANPSRQAEHRRLMMTYARKRFDWEVFVSQWIKEAEHAEGK